MRIGRYEVANETNKPADKYIVKVEKIHHDQITKETPTTKYQETHTKANDGVGRPKGEHSKIDNLTKTTCSNVTQHKRNASSIAFWWATDLHKCYTLTLTLAVQALSQPTRDDTWHYSCSFFFFFDFCFLTMIPSLLLVPSSLTIHTRQYLKTNTQHVQCLAISPS